VVGTSGQKSISVVLRLSPNEKQLFTRGDLDSVIEIGRTGQVDLPKPFFGVVWSADGSAILGEVPGALAEVSASGGGKIREIRKWPLDGVWPRSASSDGKSIAGIDKANHIWASRVEGTPEEIAIRDMGKGTIPQFSPDGRWILYSNDGLFVQPFPGPGPRRQISDENGPAAWRGDGKEILYVAGEAVKSIAVQGGPEPVFGVPQKLFSGVRQNMSSVSRNATSPLAVSRDGKRIFWLQAAEQPESNVIHVKIGAVH
jgi:hypothetical protein